MKRLPALICAFCLMILSANAQDFAKTDSLLRVFNQGEDPYERLSAGRALAKMNFQSNPEKTLLITKSGVNVLDSLKNSGAIQDSTWLDFKVSFLYYRSVAFGNLGDLDAQMDAAMERLRIVQQHGLKDREATALADIGMIYMELGHHDEARDYYERALEIEKERDSDPLNIGLALGNLVNTFGYSQLDTNLKYYNLSLEYIMKSTPSS